MYPQWIWTAHVQGRTDRSGICSAFYRTGETTFHGISAAYDGDGYYKRAGDHCNEQRAGHLSDPGEGGDLGYGMPGASEGRTEHSGIPSGRDLHGGNRSASGQYGRISSGKRSGDLRIRRYRADHGKKNDAGRSPCQCGCRTDAILRRTEAKYRAVSG